ncbi:hypothetical protein GA0116948_102360 [Chitinophaga costaii]|uniref:Uncharacterized protein n=1 Tax=Chitinophaga costaii TaxID=1335309 RepID=A0A1C4B027_9BACT|nr:hypothetical protein [Chitinophaga costaii]PUZ26815.1 hypothetical protein DCM91_10490 [Chitinophaga costaii]SCC00082.1 hypothetical protein GA0116948_102360 [Chitinophaga costaii]
MKNTLRLLFYVLALYCVETLICTVFLETEYYVKALQGHYDWGYRQALRDALEMNLVRFLGYYLFTFGTLYFLLPRIGNDRRWPVAMINCGVYVILAALCWLLAPATMVLWFKTFAIYMTIATFISPFVLRKFRP